MWLDAVPDLRSEIESHVDPSFVGELDAIGHYIQKDLLVPIFVSKNPVDLGSRFGIDGSSQKQPFLLWLNLKVLKDLVASVDRWKYLSDLYEAI